MATSAHESGNKPPPLSIAVRALLARDVASVLNIEKLSYANPWTADDLRRVLKRKHCSAFVAIINQQTVGYVVLEALPRTLQVLNMAVHPHVRRRGIGRKLIGWLADQLGSTDRRRIVTEVRETNLAMQLFLREVHFKAVEVLPKYYDDCSEDAYRFVYDLPCSNNAAP